jgi:hypothetical protein
MDPYREPARPDGASAPQDEEPPPSLRALQAAYWTALGLAVLRGVVAAYEGRWSQDVYLAVAVALIVLPAAFRAFEPRR